MQADARVDAGATTDRSAASWPLLSLTAPVAMGYVPLGAVFGFLFVQAGAPPWLALLTSLVVYAGAAQYMMIPMIVAGLSVGTVALAVAIVNLRHAFYGVSLLQRVPSRGPLRWALAFWLTDETFSVLTTLPAATPPRRMVLIAALNQGWWVLGTLLGAVVGAQATVPWSGLDFVLSALFAVLAVEQWRARSTSAPLWVALAAYALAQWLLPAHALVLAIALSLLAGALWRGPRADASVQGSGGRR